VIRPCVPPTPGAESRGAFLLLSSPFFCDLLGSSLGRYYGRRLFPLFFQHKKFRPPQQPQITSFFHRPGSSLGTPFLGPCVSFVFKSAPHPTLPSKQAHSRYFSEGSSFFFSLNFTSSKSKRLRWVFLSLPCFRISSLRVMVVVITEKPFLFHRGASFCAFSSSSLFFPLPFFVCPFSLIFVFVPLAPSPPARLPFSFFSGVGGSPFFRVARPSPLKGKARFLLF